MQLNCKVIKKWHPPLPHFYINSPPFQGYPPFLGKFWYPPPQVTQFLEGPTPFNKQGGPTMVSHNKNNGHREKHCFDDKMGIYRGAYQVWVIKTVSIFQKCRSRRR